MKRPTDKGLDPQYHIAEYADYVKELNKYIDYLLQQQVEAEEMLWNY